MHFILLYFLIINKASLTHIAESPSKRVLAFDMEINFIRTHLLLHLHVNKTNFHDSLKLRQKATPYYSKQEENQHPLLEASCLTKLSQRQCSRSSDCC